MVEWFQNNFEDPAHNTPRDEGEYVFIWGSPTRMKGRKTLLATSSLRS